VTHASRGLASCVGSAMDHGAGSAATTVRDDSPVARAGLTAARAGVQRVRNMARKITEEQAREAYEVYGSYRAAGRALGVCSATIRYALNPSYRIKMRACARCWAQANPEKRALSARKVNARLTKTGEKARANLSYRRQHPEKYAETSRRYKEANRERINTRAVAQQAALKIADSAAYRTYLDRKNAAARARRAAKKAAGL
jgi:hypothetical protein